MSWRIGRERIDVFIYGERERERERDRGDTMVSRLHTLDIYFFFFLLMGAVVLGDLFVSWW